MHASSNEITGSASPAANTVYRALPRESGLPVIGKSLDWIRGADRLLERLHRDHGSAVTVRMVGIDMTYLMGAEANQLVLQNRGGHFASSVWEELIGPFFHRGLMLLDDDEHRLHRRAMQAAFSKPALAGYLRDMQPRIQHEVGRWQPGDRFMGFAALKTLTLNIASEVFVGHAPGAASEKMNTAFLDTVQAATGIVRLGIPGTRWYRGLKGRKYLERFFAAEIAEKRAIPADDLFSRLCEARDETGEAFSDEDVINHMIFVLMAAHDISTITLVNMLYQLARNPDWQERLRQQSQAVSGDRSAALTADDLAALTDIDLAMKETLRLCAPLPAMPRKVVRDTVFDGYLLKQGSSVAISPTLTHSMSEYWQEPDKFDPERFSPERCKGMHPFQWLPFGGGAHKCIGLHFGEMEVKSILHQILLNFRWSVPADYVMEQDYTSLPIPKDGLPLQLVAL